MLDNNIRVMKSECSRLEHENRNIKGRVDENKEKIKLNKQLPYLVSNVIEILDLSDEEEDDEI
jgi:26S proteasome regulatory subunit T5